MSKKKTKIAPAIKTPKGLEVAYRKQLNRFAKQMLKAVKTELLPYLKSRQSQYVIDSGNGSRAQHLNFLTDTFNEVEHYTLDADYLDFTNTLLLDSRKELKEMYDGIGDDINLIFAELNRQFTGVIFAAFARNTAEKVVAGVSIANKRRFDRTIARSTGVDLGNIIATEGLEDLLTLSKSKNKVLIKSLPEEYLKQVETIVNNGVVSGARYSTIAKEIQKGANKGLAGRIKTIATNEIQTINAQINLRRTEALGITEGIYRTSEDEKVRKCHKELNGVQYKLAKGAWSKTCQKFIQPGITDINCR